jgi:hypothetical protein
MTLWSHKKFQINEAFLQTPVEKGGARGQESIVPIDNMSGITIQ